MSDQSLPKASVDYTLLSHFAHDTRGPFNGLLGFSELLIKQFDQLSPTQQLDYLRIINQQAVRSYINTQLFIAWVKHISDNLKIQPVSVDGEELMATIVKFIEPEIAAKELVLVTQIEGQKTKADLSTLPLAIASLFNFCGKFLALGTNVTMSLKLSEQQSNFEIQGDVPESLDEAIAEVEHWLTPTNSLPAAQLFHAIINAHQGKVSMVKKSGCLFQLTW